MTTAAPVPITPEQCRAGRRLLGWNGLDLALRAEVYPAAFILFETKNRSLRGDELQAIRHVLEAAGVVIVGDRVQLRRPPSAKGRS